MIECAFMPAAAEENWLRPVDVMPVREALMRRVVVPLDGSPASEAIVPIIKRLTRAVRCEIVLLHAVGAVPYDRGADSALYMQARAARIALAYLATVADRLTGDGGTRVRRSVWFKDPVSAINRATTTEQVDLIAMAGDGWPGLRWAGSVGVATAVTRSAAPPVLLARDCKSLGALDHVVVLLDGSPMAATILQVVSAIHDPGRTRIHCACVADPVRGLAPRDAALYLSNVALRLREEGLMVDSTFTLDQAPGAIAGFAARVDSDLVVMATDSEARPDSTRLVVEGLSASRIPMLLLRPGRRREQWH